MTNYILNPNLPSSKVSTVICGTQDNYILRFLAENKIEVIPIEINNSIDPFVSTHADMAALHLGKQRIIVDKAQYNLKKRLKCDGFEVFDTETEIRGKYPDDIKLNFTVTGDCIIGNLKHADKELLKLAADKKQINTKQGYSKCSTLVVNEEAIITDDESIYCKASQNGIEALLITKGDINLDGHEYGFIGGASGKLSNDTVVFFGDISKHRDFERIVHFLSRHGCKFVCTDNGPLRDIGGIVSLTEI